MAGRRTVVNLTDDDMSRVAASKCTPAELIRLGLDCLEQHTIGAAAPTKRKRQQPDSGCTHPRTLRDLKTKSRCRCGAIGLDPI